MSIGWLKISSDTTSIFSIYIFSIALRYNKTKLHCIRNVIYQVAWCSMWQSWIQTSGLSSIIEGCNRNPFGRRLTEVSIYEADYDAGIFDSSLGVGFNPLGNLFITFVMRGFFFFLCCLSCPKAAEMWEMDLQSKREEKLEFEWMMELVWEIKRKQETKSERWQGGKQCNCQFISICPLGSVFLYCIKKNRKPSPVAIHYHNPIPH